MGIAALVAAAFGLQSAFTRNTEQPPPDQALTDVTSNSNTIDNNTTDNTAETIAPNNTPTTQEAPPPILTTSLAQAQAEILQIVRDFDRLSNATAGTISLETNESTSPPTITYRIPGIDPDPSRDLIEGQGGNWLLSDTHRNQLIQDMADLASLLSDPSDQDLSRWVQSSVVLTPEIARHISKDELTATLVGDLVWEQQGEGWLAQNVQLDISHEQPDGTVDLGRLTTSLSASTGQSTINPPQDTSLLATELLSLQQSSADTIRASLNDEALDEQIGLEMPDRTPLTGLVSKWTISFSVPGKLLPRTLEANWNADTLDFEPVLDADENDAFDRILAARRQLSSLLVRRVQRDSDYEWLRNIYGNFSSEHLVELQLPQDDTWNLGVKPPWAAANDAANPQELLPLSASIVDGDVSIAEPAYWPLIAEYHAFSTDGFHLTDRNDLKKFATALATDVPANSLANIINNASKLGTIAPFAQTDPSLTPEFALADGQPPVLRIPVQVGFGFPDRRTLSLETIQSLEGAIGSLIGPSGVQPATLTLSMVSGASTKGWRFTNATAAVLSGAIDQVFALNNMAANLPARLQAEAAIEAQLQGEASIQLNPDQAYPLLTEIWRAKGLNMRILPTDLQAFVQKRQGDIRFAGKKAYPTVFVEYFCGLTNTYAIVWSSGVKGQQEIVEGPTLINLVPTSQLAGPAAQIPNLGHSLLGPVFDAVPLAIAAGYAGTQEQLFELKLGIAVGADDLIPADLPDLQIGPEPLVSMLIDINQNLSQEVKWQTLNELGDPNKIHEGAFKLLSGLLSDSKRQGEPDDSQAWAWDTVLKASQRP